MQSHDSISVRIRTADRQCLIAMADAETRSLVDQITVVVREACQARGIDPGAAGRGNGRLRPFAARRCGRAARIAAVSHAEPVVTTPESPKLMDR